jgi:hypothetical protein
MGAITSIDDTVITANLALAATFVIGLTLGKAAIKIVIGLINRAVG